MRNLLLAVDGNSILNRAFYGVRPLTTKEGFPTNALFGMVNIISRQVDRLSPDRLAVAFDLKAPTFRHQMYHAYKAGRRPMPEELKQQLPVAKELLSAMGFRVLEQEGYEADDILGTLARMGEEAGCEVYVLTGDRDALQLITHKTHILLTTNTDTVDMDESAFLAKYGVPSAHFVDVKALMGDSSDNIPGVPGIGEKTALRLIGDYGTLDGVYAALPEAPLTPSVKSKLESGRESAYLSKTLATISREVPLGLSCDALLTGGIEPAMLRRLFLRLEFSAFIKRFALDDITPTPTSALTAPVSVSVQEISPEELPARLSETDSIFLDRRGEELMLSDGHSVFSSAPIEAAIAAIPEGRRLVCHDCKDWFKEPALVALRDRELYDLMLGAYLANSSKTNFELSGLVSDYLGELYSEETPRVLYLARLYPLIRAKLEETEQESLLLELEMPLARVLADMEAVGFRIDREGIADYGEKLGVVASELEGRIWFYAGREFNINSPKQLGEVLFETLGLPHAKKTKTGYSTNAEILEKLRPHHPIIGEILDYRQVTKLKSTYTDGLLRLSDANGRVHTTFKQTGTATGRLSSTEPNLQNIPVRTELGRELRRFFLPENQDYVIIDADYSQIELRILAHISGDATMIRAFREGADIHTSTAATVFGIPAEAVTSDMRKKAKAVNFGILYGIGAFSLSDDLGVSRAQAQAYIDQYLAGFPEVDAYLHNTIREARETGEVRTLFGRLRTIPELSGTNKMLQKFGERVAMNSPIQGTAADIIKLAMVRVHQKLRESGLDARLILQVHDELLIESHRSCAAAAAEILREEMEHAVSYSVPLDVDIHTGNNWYEAK